MLEQQLLEDAGADMTRSERRPNGSRGSSPASGRSSSMEYSSDEEAGQPISRLADRSAREAEALRAENEAIMKVRESCRKDSCLACPLRLCAQG